MQTEVPEQSVSRRVRRRASRPAGPAKSTSTDTAAAESEVAENIEATVTVEIPAEFKSQTARKSKTAKTSLSVRPPARRPANRRLVGWISLAAALLAIAGLSWGGFVLVEQQRDATARHAREQRFVDTATQTVVNMFSYTPDTIDESVKRFVDGTSGPLHAMLSSNNNAENLKALFRSTQATSEAVINGAALEGIDTVSSTASVLVSVRVTVADIDGVNKPSMPYRLRVIVHEDDTGKMTSYDLKYPDGGN
ncbi:mammalian cell entry protein [Mycobacterium bourgelatii]|uniref:Mammalian cell entry protein n=1 Tax=Mycobacterium bourgelatii TaxID=1273442 RepID=A0A7I9YWY5_MYCBU|nr:mammalian cell entry protein [Mycobacterium bourgelatii]MCV6973276.1 mammalian cell entry protein [Mycobacterium bourgelatii]GFG93057.1 mammalian cell entry protein [Mycobacterium bourgelatii]